MFEDLRLFPSKVQERSAAKEAFEASPPEFKRVVGQVAARTMQALYNEWRGKRRGGGAGGGCVRACVILSFGLLVTGLMLARVM